MPANIDEITPCNYCNGRAAHIETDPLAAYVFCPNCFARGPAVVLSRGDWRVQAIAAWNAGRKFGKIAVAAVPGGLPAFTASAAERLRLVAENMFEGHYGAVESFVLISRAGGNANVVTHNFSPSDVVRTLDAVRDSSRIRSSIPVKPR